MTLEEQIPEMPARFVLFRHEDVHGVSGEGCVAYGIRMPDGVDGQVIYRWTSQPRTTQMAKKMAHVRHIHGHSGKTIVLWIDEPPANVIDQSDLFVEGANPRRAEA